MSKEREEALRVAKKFADAFIPVQYVEAKEKATNEIAAALLEARADGIDEERGFIFKADRLALTNRLRAEAQALREKT